MIKIIIIILNQYEIFIKENTKLVHTLLIKIDTLII
jgi:hypothetical protein